MNLLSREVKTFIVVALACFDTPSKVAKDVMDEFGIEISRQAVQAYDPTKRAGAEVCEKWRAVFESARAGFLASTETIGIAHRDVRLRRLERLSRTPPEPALLRPQKGRRSRTPGGRPARA